jgi:hypothetical protein
MNTKDEAVNWQLANRTLPLSNAKLLDLRLRRISMDDT